MIAEAKLRTLVEGFYTRVRADPDLAPIFSAHVANWGEHLDKLTDFWSSIANTSGRYKGQPVPVHMRLGHLKPELFGRWLQLFGLTAVEVLEPTEVDFIMGRAERIAQSLNLAQNFYHQKLEKDQSND